MDKNSGATNEVTEDNIKAVKEFLRAVEQLYKDKNMLGRKDQFDKIFV